MDFSANLAWISPNLAAISANLAFAGDEERGFDKELATEADGNDGRQRVGDDDFGRDRRNGTNGVPRFGFSFRLCLCAFSLFMRGK
jgi:hypothetical protein